MAWHRTLLAAVVLLAVACRLMIPLSTRDTALLAAVGAAALGCLAAALPRRIQRLYAGFTAVERRRAQATDGTAESGVLPGAGSALALTLVVAVSGLLGAASIVLRLI